MKKRALISHYVVTKRGLPCALFVVLAGQRAGVLLPSASAEPFRERRAANAALRRTEKCTRSLRESVVRDWLIEKNTKAKELLTPGEFSILAIRKP